MKLYGTRRCVSTENMLDCPYCGNRPQFKRLTHYGRVTVECRTRGCEGNYHMHFGSVHNYGDVQGILTETWNKKIREHRERLLPAVI